MFVLKYPLKAEILIQLLYSSKGKRVQALKCTHSIKVKTPSLKEISASFCAKLPEFLPPTLI